MAAARPTQPLSRRVLAGAIAALVLAAVALAAVSGVFAYRVHAAEQEEARRQAIVHAASQEAVNLMSLSYKTLDRDVQRILNGATGQLKKQFANNTKQLQRVVPKVKAVTRGEVLSAGLVSADHDSAEVLLVVDQTVKNNSGGGSSGSGGGSGSGSNGGSGGGSNGGSASSESGGEALKHYRVSMTLRLEDGRWLVSKLEFR